MKLNSFWVWTENHEIWIGVKRFAKSKLVVVTRGRTLVGLNRSIKRRAQKRERIARALVWNERGSF